MNEWSTPLNTANGPPERNPIDCAIEAHEPRLSGFWQVDEADFLPFIVVATALSDQLK